MCFKRRSGSLPEAAVDDEEDGNEEGGHLAGVDQGVRPVEEQQQQQQQKSETEIQRKYCL